MMTIRRVLGLVLLVSLGMSACSPANDQGLEAGAPGSPPEAGSGEDLVTTDRIGRADAPNSFTLQMNTAFTHLTADPQHAQSMDTLYQQWAEENPDWRVDLRIVPDDQAGQASVRLLEQARTGQAADCASVNFPELPVFLEQGILQPLTEHFSDEEIESFFPYVRDLAVDDGDLYAMWWTTDGRAIIRNTDLVPDAPGTWEETIQAALDAQEREPGVDGLLFNGGRWIGTSFDATAYYFAEGGELVDDQGRPTFHEGNNKEIMIDVFGFLSKAVETGASPLSVTDITDYRQMVAPAVAGDTAMILAGAAQYLQLQKELSPEEFKKWEVSPMPGSTPATRTSSVGGWSIVALSEDDAVVAKCAEFARDVYLGPANEALLRLPASDELFDTLPFLQDPIYEPFRDVLELGHAATSGQLYGPILNELSVAINSVLTGSPTEQAINDAARAVIEVYEQQPVDG